MGVTFFGSGSTLRDDDVVRFGHLRFWAERGLIHVEDARDNSYESISVRTALRRMNAIIDMLGNSTRREIYTEDRYDQAERQRHIHMLDGLRVLCERARVQGMPTDPSARRDLVRRRPKTVVVPALYGGGM